MNVRSAAFAAIRDSIYRDAMLFLTVTAIGLTLADIVILVSS